MIATPYTPPMPRKSFRVAFLLTILVAAGWLAVISRPPPPPDWKQPLQVVIYPYNADGSDIVADHIADRRLQDFKPIADFMAEQAAQYNLPIDRPFTLAMGREISRAPSLPPESRNLITRIHWGLTVRWWQYRFRDQVNKPDIIVVARYHRADELPEKMHSIAIAAQRLAVAKLVAEPLYSAHNHVVLAHEILHTVGASDLYEPESGLPLYPSGYAEPERQPLYPQRRAELMAGRIPGSPGRMREVFSLAEVVIGEVTAREIGCIRNP
jgi:hypothetical protein